MSTSLTTGLFQSAASLAILEEFLEPSASPRKVPVNARAIVALSADRLIGFCRRVAGGAHRDTVVAGDDCYAVWTATDVAGWSLVVIGHVGFRGGRPELRHAEYHLPGAAANRLYRMGKRLDRVREICGV